MTIAAVRNIVQADPIDTYIGGSRLLTRELTGLGIDFAYPYVGEQLRIKDLVATANNFRGDPAGKLVYTSPSVKRTMRSNGILAATNGSTDLPYEWDSFGTPYGLLIEAAKTNICTWSQDFSNAVWLDDTSTTQTTAAAVAPDGTTTGNKFAEDTGTGLHEMYNLLTITSGAVYTYSAYFKAVERSWCTINAYDGADNITYFQLTGAGTVGTNAAGNTASIEKLANGWYRAQVTRTSGSVNGAMVIQLATADATNSYTGTVGSGIFVWGAQYELGAFASSYIPTTTASVTRAADNISLATSAFNYSATVGTLYAMFRPRNVAAIRFAAAMDDATANERFAIGSSAAAAGSFSVIDGGVAQTAPLTTGTVVAKAINKVAVRWSANNFALSVNGGAVATDVVGTLPTVTSLKLGTAVSAASPLDGWLSELVHLPRISADAELISRSSK